MVDFKVGTPYNFRDHNCWHYVADIRKQVNISTKLFKPTSLKNAFKTITAQMQTLEHGLTLVTAKEDYDIVIVKKGAVYHCGLIFGNDVVHCSRPLGQVVKESFVNFTKPYEGFTLWR